MSKKLDRLFTWVSVVILVGLILSCIGGTLFNKQLPTSTPTQAPLVLFEYKTTTVCRSFGAGSVEYPVIFTHQQPQLKTETNGVTLIIEGDFYLPDNLNLNVTRHKGPMKLSTSCDVLVERADQTFFPENVHDK